MPKYSKGIRKIADDTIMVAPGDDITEMAQKCIAAGYWAFSWNSDIYVIPKQKIFSAGDSKSTEGNMYAFIKTPFTLKDFEL